LKAVILAGGYGTRLSEETVGIPKPMVEIGDRPILWHIMKIFAHYGFDEFVVCLGYKGDVIKDYFVNFFNLQSDFTVDLSTGRIDVHNDASECWRVTLVDTGLNTMTGGRVKRIERYVNGETFLLTYGDGVADVDLEGLVRFHKSHGRLATVTAIREPSRFGALDCTDGQVLNVREKPVFADAWINGGFFVLEPGIFSYLDSDSTIWERGPMENLARDGQLMAYHHEGFWQPMDTTRDKNLLEDLWARNSAPWKVWP